KSLKHPAVRDGDWQLLDCTPAWDGNWTVDCFIAFTWRGKDGKRLVVAVNYAPNQSQCYVQLPFDDLTGKTWVLNDLTSLGIVEREGDDIASGGLYLDMLPWDYNVLELNLSKSRVRATKRVKAK